MNGAIIRRLEEMREVVGCFDKKYGGGVGEASKERKTILQNQGNKDRDEEQGTKEEGSKVEANFDFEKNMS